jgi:arylsulfatase A
MNFRFFRSAVLLLLMMTEVALSADDVRQSGNNPNIILILADDLGYECLGVNGGRSYRTPNLDRMAREGVRFEHCYAQPNCTPTRTQLMTGMSNVRNYVSFGSLEKSQTTFAHLFRRAGYATCIAGKWQLGSRDAGLPKHFGFDEHCLWAHMGRGERYADPSLSVNGEFKTFAGKYGPDVCQEFVVDFIRRHRKQPFFVYYPMILTHGGYEATPDSKDWGQSTAKSKKLKQEHFADMVEYMDKQVGALARELDALGLRDNTLILFTGDNGTGRGAVTEVDSGDELAGEKGSTTRGGMRVPLIANWPGKIAAGTVCRDLVDMTDFLPTLCEATGVAMPKNLPHDGRSFLPQLRGEQGTPREWIYSYWVPLRANQTAHVGDRGAVEQAFDHRYKLYSTGEFFDLQTDVEEQSPARVSSLSGDAATAAARLQAALERYKHARPADLPAPRDPADKKKEKKKKKQPN